MIIDYHVYFACFMAKSVNDLSPRGQEGPSINSALDTLKIVFQSLISSVFANVSFNRRDWDCVSYCRFISIYIVSVDASKKAYNEVDVLLKTFHVQTLKRNLNKI
jgi:hypothetical protein